MASPGEFKGQRRGACGHVMAAFDLHERCARCRDKKLGDDPCVKDKPCSLCDSLSESQKETLSTPLLLRWRNYRLPLLRQHLLLRKCLRTQHRICSNLTKKTDKKSHRHSGRHSDKSTDRHGDKVDINPVGSHQPPTGPSQTDIQDSTSTGSKSVPPKLYPQSDVQPTGPPVKEASATGPAASCTQSSSHLSPYGTTGPDDFSQAATYSELPFDPEDSDHYSGSEPDEGEISDTGEKPEVTEDMNCRETVRSVRSFMGWNHIPVFEADFGEPDKSNNPWKGKVPKRPARVSVAMPPDDWLCQKLERLNTTVAEGYPSRSQDSGGLKKDQFIKMPKSQARWYQMHTIKPDIPHRPGKSVFSWRNTEAKVNSQFPRITKASAYPPSGPVSRPISQEYLRRWERNAKEGSYIVNQAAGFNRCASELQDRMTQSLACLQSNFSKGKAPKEVSESLRDLKDYLPFHQNVSITMGTSLQHLADSPFVNMANLVLLRRDSYLEHIKPGVKPDTWNRLRNAPLFSYGLFPDDMICIAEQDITKSESTSAAPRPGPGAMQRTGWRSQNRFQPYDRREARSSAQSEPNQPWRQFARGRGRSTGRGRSSNPRFSCSRGFKNQK